MQLFDTILNTIAKMAKTPLNYWTEFALDIPLGIILTFEGLRNNELNSSQAFQPILIGLFLFSFLEYSVHRWLFHGSVEFITKGHRAHHDNPSGYDALPFFSPAAILLMLTAIFVLLIPAHYAYLLSGTIALSYVIYGLSHFVIHHHRFHNIFARNWAANHHIHHYHANTNFGVTTPLWDILLGTRYLYDRKRI